MSINIQRISPLVNVWIVRLNGTGSTFDAVCTVSAVNETTLLVEGGMSHVKYGMQQLVKQASPHFRALGYTHYQYVHNHTPVKKRLRV